jgi:hypothetical protein
MSASQHAGWLIGLGFHNAHVQWEGHSVDCSRFHTSRSSSGRLLWEIP